MDLHDPWQEDRTPAVEPAPDVPQPAASPPAAAPAPLYKPTGYQAPPSVPQPAPPSAAVYYRVAPQVPGQLVIDNQLFFPAGFWPRCGAFLLDMLLLLTLHSLLVWLAGIKQPTTEESMQLLKRLLDELLQGGMFSAQTMSTIQQFQRPAQFAGWLNIALCAAYFTVFQGYLGTTFGKACFGLRVLRADGRPLGPGLAFFRYLGYLICSKLAYTAWLIPLDQQRRTLYDLLLRCNVFRAQRN